MTCESCQKNRKFTYNMTLRCCQVRWLRNATQSDAHTWLAEYRTQHGKEAMLNLIAEAKTNG